MRSYLTCKGLLALRVLEYKENFCRSLESFVNVLAHDCYASCLDISVDLLIFYAIDIYFVEVKLNFCRVVTCLEEDCEGDLHHFFKWIISSFSE